ncbi:glycosyltransferase family 4 protein [Chlorogloeopsis sp. ULAP01]|uniref:glycosyltransferase family 4 protein n=1 Tax=Chlorogloeopsis sp. ULAP01 TaxID=3056483 RepID=UPI0025AB1973|nr:glycosyltransferase family 4 protein [Chlorogloeopsis sp. ULAP01]MDM9384401.1 glycosyltransferase family 4 protein [Chlorogloeopsis sp. ULAP01]
MSKSRLAYVSFDNFPGSKGAAIHIAAFSQALAATFGDVQLVTVSPTVEILKENEIYPQVRQTMLPAIGKTLIHRVLSFRRSLQMWFQGKRFEVVQIRSIYEGLPIALNKKQYCDRLIFEVNGLPSIELKYRYPAIADDKELLHKLRSQEQICLEVADLIVTPSTITSQYLQSRGISSQKIRVIPNGVDLKVFTYFSGAISCSLGFLSSLQDKFLPGWDTGNTPLQMLYFGTLSPWQGVNLAIEALQLINQNFPAYLTVIGQARNYQIKALQKLAFKLGVADKLIILEPMSQSLLVKYIHASNLVLAPLTPSDRNLVQGCCPLKILEAMATGIPVIASDLPVVRELGVDGVHFLLVKPGSAKAIKDAALRLRQEPQLTKQLTTNARKRIEETYTWESAGKALIAAYTELGIKRSIMV